MRWTEYEPRQAWEIELRRIRRRMFWRIVRHRTRRVIRSVDWFVLSVWVGALLFSLLFWAALIGAAGLLR